MIRHPLGLEWGTVGGEEGWLDPRVKDVKKLLPKNMGAKEERKIWKQLSQQQAKERHSKRWFVGDKTVKGTKPDLTPVKNVGGKKGMRSLLQKRTKDLAWEKGWSQLNPDQIAELGGKGDRVTNRVAQQLMRADELAVQKALGQPLSSEVQQLNQQVDSRDRINQALTRTEERRNARRGINVNNVNRETEIDLKNTVSQETAPKLPETGWSNVFTKGKDGNMVGVMSRNQRLAWEKANFQQQQSLIEPGKLGQLGTNVQGGLQVGGNTAGEIEKKKPEIEKKPDITKKDIPNAETPKLNPPKIDPPKTDVKPPTKLEGWDKAKDITKNLGLPHPAVMIARAIAFLANPNAGDRGETANNRIPNLAKDGLIDEENLKYMA